MFNRRRGGEAERVLLSVYKDSEVQKANEDVEKCLSNVECTLCKEFRILYTEGKHGRKVPILLTKHAQEQLRLLVDTRDTVGVSRSKEYLFAR